LSNQAFPEEATPHLPQVSVEFEASIHKPTPLEKNGLNSNLISPLIYFSIIWENQLKIYRQIQFRDILVTGGAMVWWNSRLELTRRL